MSSTIAMHLAPSADNVAAYAAEAVKNFIRIENTNLDYSINSLKHLDRVLLEWKEQNAPVGALNKSLFAMGAYAGEVLLKNRPGKWQAPSGKNQKDLQKAFISIKLDNQKEWNPIYNAFLIMLCPTEATAQCLFSETILAAL